MPECPAWAAGEALLRETDQKIGGLPVLECSNCGFRADHLFWYEGANYALRKVQWCPSCRLHILGVVRNNG